MSAQSVGLVINPIAGMGGRVGLKGTDGPERLAQAIALGAVPFARERVARALEGLESGGRVKVLAAAGAMGADDAALAGFEAEVVCTVSPRLTTAADTRTAAGAIVERGVALLMFAGGDGTARDVMQAVGTRVPVIGIPTGVKMHSGVFAATPRAAGVIAAAFLASPRDGGDVRRAEVVDRVQDGTRRAASVRLLGEMLVPADPTRVLPAKAMVARSDDAEVHGLQLEIVREMEPARIYVLGPGTTVGGIRRELGIRQNPLAVAAVRDRELLADDLSEDALLEVLADGRPATIVLGVIGGQGSLLGRGNQELGPRVLRRVGPGNVLIVSSLQKLTSLAPLPLQVDTGDPELDAELAGYRLVRVGPRRSVLFPVAY